MPTVISQFRTPAGQAAYEAAYRRTLSLWPAEHESFFVTTSFGETHVLGLGDPHATPMVLVHGFGFSAVQWYPNAPALAKHFRIYAPDVPDQLGLSQLTKPIFTARNYAIWMRELVNIWHPPMSMWWAFLMVAGWRLILPGFSQFASNA